MLKTRPPAVGRLQEGRMSAVALGRFLTWQRVPSCGERVSRVGRVSNRFRTVGNMPVQIYSMFPAVLGEGICKYPSGCPKKRSKHAFWGTQKGTVYGKL